MKKTNYPIFIPSKGRANNCLTAQCLSKYDIDFSIVVEKEEENNYKQITDQILVLDRSNCGLPYARTWIKNYAKSKGFLYHWQIDDDVVNFLIRKENKNVISDPFDMFVKVENETEQYENIAYSSFRDCVFGWSQKEEISYNKMKSTVVLFNSFIDAEWDHNLLEDYDYSLNCLFKGYCSILFNRYMYHKKPNNQAAGGIKSIQKYDMLKQKLVEKYKEFMKLYLNDKKQLKVNSKSVWRLFTQKPVLKNQKINSIENFFDVS